jgi:GntR family transcriptional regulator / MocR family aminotransferase
MYPWRSVIQLKKNSRQPVYLQITNAIIKEIHEGRLTSGQKLPGARSFGKLLNLNRKTIVAAMEELYSQGWVEMFAQKGTFVSNKLPEIVYQPLTHQHSHPAAKSVVAHAVNDLPFLEPLQTDLKNTILVDDGVPDVRLAPLSAVFKHQRSLISKKSFTSLLKYSAVEGDIDLRTTLKHHLHTTRGIVTTAANIFITRGSQMGIYLVAAALIKKGDTCITSFPGYPIVDAIIHHLGGKTKQVAVDANGIITSEIEKICRRKKIKLLYITPHHHYPTTVTLSPARRIELLQLALKYDFYIMEDDYDYDFHYSNNPVLPLASLNKSGHVIYIGSFSKCLAPAIRIGYFVAPVEILEAANKLRRIVDRQGDPVLERSLSEFIKSGDLERHLKKMVKIYERRRNYFCSLLEEHLGDHLHFTPPEGGMSVWVVFTKNRVVKKLPEQLARKGYRLDADNTFIEHFNALRIGFASMREKEMDKFVMTVKNMLTE